MENLDHLCAEYGYRFAEEVKKSLKDAKRAESLITKSLAVLQEQGLYSFGLFCSSRGEAEIDGANKIKEVAQELLREKQLKLIGNGDFLEEIRKDGGLATRIDELMLAIQVLEKSLIYARFHVKAMAKS